MFSQVASRLHAETNSLYILKNRLTAEGRKIIDLVSGNVTENGIVFPEGLLADIMSRCARRCSIYRPDSFGRREAREAISSYYAGRDIRIDADRILLTPGTSIAYWYCFKLLADDGDEILCPQPSYPLFDYIAALCGVRMVAYRLCEERSWALDLDQLEASISTRTRAIVHISPHNPTGRVASPPELEQLADIARRHSLALISDEVFSEFLLDDRPFPRPASMDAPLVLTLNGFSKMLALPGIKLGWIAVSGVESNVRQALRSLELISDTFLPVGEIVQEAVPELFSQGTDFLSRYRSAVRERWHAARIILEKGEGCAWTAPGGGFYVTLKLLEADEEEAARCLLNEDSLLLHPGYFYDMQPHHLVLSFVHEPAAGQAALARMARTIARLPRRAD